jgi:hypothetical protein
MTPPVPLSASPAVQTTNDLPHYDPAKKPTLEDARDLLDFLRELMKYLYEMPADLRRRRGTR